MQNFLNSNAMTVAVLRNDRAAIAELVGTGFPIRERSLKRQSITPFGYAIERKKWIAATALLDLGAEPESTANENGYSALHQACAAGEAELAKALLAKGLDPNEETPDGRTALSLAITAGQNQAELVRLLLSADASVFSREDERTLLHMKIRSDEVVPLLVDAGVDVNANYQEETPLMVALRDFFDQRRRHRKRADAEERNLNVIRRLLECGADPSVTFQKPFGRFDDAIGKSIVEYARFREFPEPLVKLLEDAPGPNAKSELRKKK